MKTCFLRAPLAALPLAILATFSHAIHAQALIGSDTVALLKETVITATRVETRTDAVLSDVVVIEADDIARAAGRSLSELLSRRAGLQLSANGGLGKQSGLFVRGTEARHVLVLIDGVRYGSSTSGSAVLDNIPLSGVDRIEVLKGPASALYGSDAVGGVVQIFTRRGAQGLAPQASVTLGPDGHRSASAGIGGGIGAVNYSVHVGHVREDGFSSTNPKVSFGNHNPDRDGFDQDSVAASLRWAVAPGWATDIQFTQADGVSRYDQGPGMFDVRSDATMRVAAWGVERQWSATARTRLQLARSDDKSDNYGAPGAPSVFDTAQTHSTLQHDWTTAWGNMVAGAESIREDVSGTQAYAVKTRTTTAAFVGLSGQAGRHLWQGNLRRDDNSQFGGATTGFASYGLQLTPHWRPHVAYGTSFKMPSFNTLYFVSPSFKGNPTTQPERGRNREAGLTYSNGPTEVKLTRFDNRVRGFITTQPVVANVPRARMAGWSIAATDQRGAWRWNASLELLDARNLVSGLKLQRRADEVLNVGLDHGTGAWQWGAALQLVSDRFDNASNTQRLAGFGTLDLHARYAIDKAWSLAFRLNNAGDKVYETAYGYNQPRRAAYVTLQWAPQR